MLHAFGAQVESLAAHPMDQTELGTWSKRSWRIAALVGTNLSHGVVGSSRMLNVQ